MLFRFRLYSKVSTDVLFGIANTTENEGAWKIVQQADGMKKYGEIDTYLGAYDVLLDGLKKYPNNLFIMLNCMHLALAFLDGERVDICK